MNAPTIRECHPHDLSDLVRLYKEAFPEEDLVPLVKELLSGHFDVLSLVSCVEDTLIGHVLFTLCSTTGGNQKVALLAPLAVTPAWQRKGIGSSLVRDGFTGMRQAGATHICVLGDPAYYGRFGLQTERKIASPYPLPPGWGTAWQGMDLDRNATIKSGKLVVPEPWQHPSLWSSE